MSVTWLSHTEFLSTSTQPAPHNAKTIRIVRSPLGITYYITYACCSELEREANIARNRTLLQELELKEAVSSLGIPKPAPPKAKSNAKPVQPSKKVKRERNEDGGPRRTSARLRTAPLIDPNESPGSKRKREVRGYCLVDIGLALMSFAGRRRGETRNSR